MQTLIDAALRAAELVALLVVLPVAAAELPLAQIGTPAERTHTAQSSISRLDVRLLGTSANVRTRERIRNDGATAIDLATQLPAVDEHTEALRIHRQGRSVDLLHFEGCGDDIDGNAALIAGHARLAVDEAIADALQLAPGETALIETITRQPLAGAGSFFRLAVPRQTAVESRAWLIDQTDAPFLIMIAGRGARGSARLTLRPTHGATETIELGELADAPVAYVIPLADHAALHALAGGAIELEAQAKDYVMWSTLAVQMRSGASLAVVQSAAEERAR